MTQKQYETLEEQYEAERGAIDTELDEVALERLADVLYVLKTMNKSDQQPGESRLDHALRMGHEHVQSLEEAEQVQREAVEQEIVEAADGNPEKERQLRALNELQQMDWSKDAETQPDSLDPKVSPVLVIELEYEGSTGYVWLPADGLHALHMGEILSNDSRSVQSVSLYHVPFHPGCLEHPNFRLGVEVLRAIPDADDNLNHECKPWSVYYCADDILREASMTFNGPIWSLADALYMMDDMGSTVEEMLA
jgi:hypothetical protein